MTRRLVQLYAGLVLYGVSLALMVRAELGLDPWDVFHRMPTICIVEPGDLIPHLPQAQGSHPTFRS